MKKKKHYVCHDIFAYVVVVGCAGRAGHGWILAVEHVDCDGGVHENDRYGHIRLSLMCVVVHGQCLLPCVQLHSGDGHEVGRAYDPGRYLARHLGHGNRPAVSAIIVF